MDKGMLAVADNLGFIRLVTPFDEEEKFHQRMHSVTKNANPITFFVKRGNQYLAGYQNGDFAVYEIENSYLQQIHRVSCREFAQDIEIPIHHDYFDRLHNGNKLSVLSAFLADCKYYVLLRSAEVLILSDKCEFVSKFQLPFKPGKFMLLEPVFLSDSVLILQAGYQIAPCLYDLAGQEICRFQSPRVEYLTNLARRFEIVAAAQQGGQIFFGDACGYMYRYDLNDLSRKQFVGQCTRTGIDDSTKCLQLLSCYRVAKYMLTALCPLTPNYCQLNDVQEKQLASAVKKGVCFEHVQQIKRGTNLAQPKVQQTLFRHRKQLLLFGTAIGALGILEASSGMLIWQSHRHSMGCVTALCQSGDYFCSCEMDKMLAIYRGQTLATKIYIVGDACAVCEVAPLRGAEAPSATDEPIEQEWEPEEEATEDLKEADEVGRIDLGFFDDL